MFALEMRERLGRRQRSRRGELANAWSEALRERCLPRKVRLAHGRAEQRIIVLRDEVQRLPHDGRLDDGAARELTLERVAFEARRACPDPDVRSGGPLRLHPDEALDHRGRREALALQEELPRERRAVQLALREDALGHYRSAMRASAALATV